MKFETSTLMMLFFIIFLIISIWKIYAFLPNKQLADDDTTNDSQQQLQNLMLNIIKKRNGNIDGIELFELMKNDKDFDKKHFWRFNQNKLNQLLVHYYMQNPHAKSIEDIYKNIK
ncbi:hypothetical protein KKG72_02570 [bacterium]|nr:hypothetical protein [bacterium]MBU1994382.1 hypothetical protein [bacterium]